MREAGYGAVIALLLALLRRLAAAPTQLQRREPIGRATTVMSSYNLRPMRSIGPAALLRLDGEVGWATELLCSDLVLRCDSQTLITTLAAGEAVLQRWNKPLDALRWLGAEAANSSGTVRWVGYLSYDVGRLVEAFLPDRRPALSTPLFCFARTVKEMAEVPAESGAPVQAVAQPNFTRDEYQAAVGRVISYIAAGDVFQVNLAQQLTVPCSLDAWTLSQRLRDKTPGRYAACLDFGDHAIVSNSPELFVRVDADRIIRTSPIKGTRARLPGGDRELMDSVKDAAELNMIVDLERNDLGRICKIGSVRVERPRTVEAHPTVYHGVATVAGTLRPEVDFVDILRAMFPGGSITGAPKIRAMQIIDELEPARRGPYCGAIGWLGAGGVMQFNVAIRTIVLTGGVATMSVGGGIVADSEPAAEYEETLLKASAMLAALNARMG